MKLEYNLESFYKELVEEYLNNKKSELEGVMKALANADYSTLKVVGHNLAGTGGSYGLSSLTDIGDQLEKAAEKNDLNQCIESIKQYNEFLENVKVEFNE